MDRTRAVALSGAILAFLLLVGCGKKDHVVGPDPPRVPSPYPIRSSPENAVLYYKAAWENRDSTRIDSVVAADYVGTSSLHGSPLPDFSQADEIRAVGGIELDPEVFGVSINLGSPSLWIRQTYASDPAGWIALDLPHVDVRVYTTSADLVANTATFMEFKLRPTTPAPTSPTDTLWSIVRWTEIAD
jgi:hypothetical protein